MWRRLLALAHPDRAGDHDFFIWCQGLREHVAGDSVEDLRTTYERRQPPAHPTTGDRIDFTRAYDVAGSFDQLTDRALRIAEEVEEPYRHLLRLAPGGPLRSPRG